MKQNMKNLTLSAMFLALGLVLPFLTGQIPQVGGGRGGQGGASGDDRADDPVGEPVGEVAEDVVVGHELPVVLRHRP